MLDFVASSLQSLIAGTIETPPLNGTICFWFKNKSSGEAGYIFNQSTSHRINVLATNYLDVALLRKFNRPLTSTIAPTIGVWYHVACVYDTTVDSYNAFYFNGVFDTSSTDTYQARADQWIYIGVQEASNFKTCELDDFRYYNRVLSDAEIETIYACRGTDGIVDGLIHRWPMDEKAPGVSVTDGSPKDVAGANDLYINYGAPTYGETELKKRRIA